MAVKELPGILSKGSTLSYKNSTWIELGGVKSIPAMGSDPEKLDVTHLKSESRQCIAGLQDNDTLEFTFINQSKNFADIHTLVQANKEYEWQVKYPDGSLAEFTGKPVLKTSAVEVNGVLEFSLSIVCSVSPHFTPSTGL